MSTTDKLKAEIGTKKTAVVTPMPMSDLANRCFKTIMKQETIKAFSMALPKNAKPERFARIIWTECRKSKELLKAEPASLISACMIAAQLNLEIGSHLGQAYLVPFEVNKKIDGQWVKTPQAQLIIGYRGLITLARKSGDMISLNAYAVYEKDDFSYHLGLHPDIHHIPSSDADRGNLLYVYAVANFVGGGVQFEVMSRAEVEKVRNESQGYKFAKRKAESTKPTKPINSPWVSHFEEMAKKTVIRRLAKYLPPSVEAARAVAADEAADRGETPWDVVDASFVETGGEIPPEDFDKEEPIPSTEDSTTNPKTADQPPLDEAWLRAYDTSTTEGSEI